MRFFWSFALVPTSLFLLARCGVRADPTPYLQVVKDRAAEQKAAEAKAKPKATPPPEKAAK